MKTRLSDVEAFVVVVLVGATASVALWSWFAIRRLLALTAEPGDD